MAGMAVAWGTKAAMVPAGGLQCGSRIEARGAAAGAAAAGAMASGLGRMSLRRLQLNRVVVSSPTGEDNCDPESVSRFLVLLRLNICVRSRLGRDDLSRIGWVWKLIS